MPDNAAAASRPRARLIVADDEESFLQLIRVLATIQPNIELVGEAADGVEAVELAIALHPDAVILDCGMPRMSGLDAAALIHAALPDVRLYLHSAVLTPTYELGAALLSLPLLDKFKLDETLAAI